MRFDATSDEINKAANIRYSLKAALVSAMLNAFSFKI